MQHGADTATAEPAVGRGKAAKARRPRSLGELDRRTCDLDRRGLPFLRYDEIRRAVLADLGGADAATTAEAQIIDKAAFIAMTLERMQIAALSNEDIDLQRYGELTDRLRRLLEAIGLQRRAKDLAPSLVEYAARFRAQEAAGESSEDASPCESKTPSNAARTPGGPL